MNIVSAAMLVAKLAHAGQTRRGGEPYFHHLATVAGRVICNGWHDNVVAAAYLHDSVEDRRITADEVLFAFGGEVSHMVSLLTKADGEDYLGYIRKLRAANHAGAIAIKIADIEHNLSDNPGKKAKTYMDALRILKGVE